VNEKKGQKLSRQQTAYTLVNSRNWTHLMSIVISLHCIAIYYTKFDALDIESSISFYLTIGSNFFFVLEVSLATYGAGSVGVAITSAKFVFELVTTIMGIFGIILNIKFLLVFPAVRLYRLMTYFPTLHHLLHKTVDSTSPIVNLCVFLIMVGTTVALTGRYVFGAAMDDITRSNFGSLGLSLLTTFQLLTGDGWSEVVFDAVYSLEALQRRILAVAFIVLWIIFATFVLTNIFIAVIIENFEVVLTIKDIKRPGHIYGMKQLVSNAWQRYYTTMSAYRRGDIQFNRVTGQYLLPNGQVFDPSKVPKTSRVRGEASGGSPTGAAGGKLGLALKRSTSARMMAWNDVVTSVVVHREKKVVDFYTERSLYFFYPKNKYRIFAIYVAEHPLFQTLIISIIVLNCFMMFITPAYRDLNDDPVLIPPFVSIVIDYVSTVVFSVEFLVMVVSLGLINTRHAYLKSGWNVLDTFVLAFSWFDVLATVTGMEGDNLGAAKVFRLFRALRPLRLMKRNEGMRVVIDALIATLAPVLYVIIFSLTTFFVAALIGMGLMGGKMSYCSGTGAEYPGGRTQCVNTWISEDNGVLRPRAWLKPYHHFDTLPDAILSLFMVGTLEYLELLQRSMDITDCDLSPQEDSSQHLAIFFVCYIIIGSLFVMNLFVGFIVDGFNLHKGSSNKDIIFNRLSRQIVDHRPRPKTLAWLAPSNAFSVWLEQFLNGVQFQVFSALCVVINVCFMLADHTDPSPEFTAIMDAQNLFFFIELGAELLAYLFAVGPGGLVDDLWKNFDMFVFLGTFIGYVSNNKDVTQFVKAFRLLRVVRLMIIIKKIRIILETLIKCIPQLANILVLLFLVYSMFAVIGVQAFSSTKYGKRLGPTANFDDWPSAMVTCFQIVVGDAWHDIMDDCGVQPPECTPVFDSELFPDYGYNGPAKSFGDCGSTVSTLYFMAFKLMCETIMLNLFIGMILENFAFITDEVSHSEEPNWDSGASADQILELVHIFSAVASLQNETGDTMALENLPQLMNAMPLPLGHRRRDGKLVYEEKDRIITRMIRAELNVIVMDNRELKEEVMKGTWRGWWYHKLQGISLASSEDVPQVTFKDVMMTLVYWRKPNLVPELRKMARSARVQKVIFVAHCLTLKESLQMHAHIRKQERENAEKIGTVLKPGKAGFQLSAKWRSLQ